jgi:DNA-binding CsgD family transcriptional regulator
MQRLKASELARVAPLIRRLYSAESRVSFARTTLKELRAILHAESASYNVIDARTGATQWLVDGLEDFPGSTGIFAEHIREHPLVMHYARSADGSALKISDFVGNARFRQSGLYQEFYRRLGTGYQIAVRLPSPPKSVIGLAFSRGQRDFSERDRVILNALRLHLSRAFEYAGAVETAQEHMGRALQSFCLIGFHVLMLGPCGNVVCHSPEAGKIIDGYFGELRRTFLEFVAARSRDIESICTTFDDVAPQIEPRKFHSARGELLVYVIPGERYSTVILKERCASDTSKCLRERGLSPREASVLLLAARGFSDKQIAEELAISWRTVRKHLEHVYVKLGVNSRAAAIAAGLSSLA